MPRPKNTVPAPNLRKRKDAWQIRWRYDNEDYGMSIGAISKEDAKITCAAVALALAEKEDWPTALVAMPAVKRYLAKKSGNEVHNDDKQLIKMYAEHMKVNGKSNWYSTVRNHLNAASNFTGNLLKAQPDIITAFLNAIREEKSAATRNRALASLSGFFKWLRLMKVFPKGHNPLDGIKILKEERPPDGIIIWEKNEIPKLLKAADKCKDGIAIWIAIHAGLRRSEIARLAWSDITPAYILIGKSKTSVKRQVPLSKVLAKKLENVKRTGPRIVPWPEAFHGWETAARRLIYERLKTELGDIYKKHPEKFGWNAFRHTFASRHAQAGLPIDIIASWLGDSPKVCKEHYARYVPANMRDTRIDLVDEPVKKATAKRTSKKKAASKKKNSDDEI